MYFVLLYGERILLHYDQLKSAVVVIDLLVIVDSIWWKCLQVGVEGLQALKPHCKNAVFKQERARGCQVNTDGKTIGNTDSVEGVDIEVCLVLPEDESAEAGRWIVENIKFSVKQPVSKSL